MKKNLIKFLAAALVVVLTLPTLVSCAPPKLDEVRGTFEALIEGSFEINEILFGDGLSTYGDLTYDAERKLYYTVYHTAADGKLCAYYDSESKSYKVLRFGEKGEGTPVYEDGGVCLYATSLTFEDDNKDLPASPPAGYDFVRADERCKSISDILNLAAAVYSEEYLRGITTTMFAADDKYTTLSGLNAKYAEYEYTKGGILGTPEQTVKLLMRANHKSVEPLMDEQRTYDYSTMKLLRNSRKNFVTIEIQSYGPYANLETGKVETGWSTVRLSFVRQNGEWRLDSPTY